VVRVHSINKRAGSIACRNDGGEVVHHPFDVLCSGDAAIEDEILHAGFDQHCSFGRTSAPTVLGVAAKDRPAMLGRFQHPLGIGDLLVTRDPVVLGEGHDAEPSLA